MRYDGSVSPSYEYSYTASGNLGLVKDHENDQRTRYVYDASGNLVSVRTISGADGDDGTAKVSLDYSYSNETGQLTGDSARLQNGAAVEMGYTYRPQDGKLGEIYRDGTKEIVYSYTTLDRLYTRTLYLTNGNAKTTTYTYLNNSDGSTTPYVSAMYNGSQTYGYTYDENGNILTVKIGGVLKYAYEYDRYNRLTKEIDHTGGAAVTRTYTYDSNGNRLTKAVSGGQSSTETYTYAATNGWKDQLTGYNGVGLTYDASGNPLSYYNGSVYTMTWENGRQLSTLSKGGVTTGYTYNDSGIRTKKMVGSTVTEYFVEGGLLLGQKTGSNVMQFLYEGGSIYGFLYNGTPYYYQFNGQGDVVSVLNGAGTTVATYLYDAWGNLTSSSGSMAATNPIRYRGYYYDIESGFYYLQSRYYDPKTGRFINADSLISGDMTGENLYVYCGNNPVIWTDPYGKRSPKYFGSSPIMTKLRKASEFVESNEFSEEQAKILATMYGEVGTENFKIQQAVGHVIKNQKEEPRDKWVDAKTYDDILVKSSFNAVDGRAYKEMQAYLRNRDGSNEAAEQIIVAYAFVFIAEAPDFTGGAHYFYNPKTSNPSFANPEYSYRYERLGPFNWCDDSEFRMYRCLY